MLQAESGDTTAANNEEMLITLRDDCTGHPMPGTNACDCPPNKLSSTCDGAPMTTKVPTHDGAPMTTKVPTHSNLRNGSGPESAEGNQSDAAHGVLRTASAMVTLTVVVLVGALLQ